jgi:hypothetical protein
LFFYWKVTTKVYKFRTVIEKSTVKFRDLEKKYI